jgi:nitrogen fixation protein NifB
MLAEITLLVHAVDPEIAMSVYAWVRPGRRTVALSEGVNRLLADQVASAEKLSELGVPVIIESRCFPGANQGHLPEVADVMAGAGAAAMRIISGTSETGECGGVFLERIRGKCAQRIEILPEEPDIEPPAPEVFLDESRPRVAVASTDGAAVNAHLGQSRVLMIYEMQGGAPAFLGTRQTPPPGTEDRWLKLAEILPDCRALLVAHAGEAPRKVLAENGVRLLQSEGGIDKAVERIFKSGSGHKAPDCGKGEC